MANAFIHCTFLSNVNNSRHETNAPTYSNNHPLRNVALDTVYTNHPLEACMNPQISQTNAKFAHVPEQTKHKSPLPKISRCHWSTEEIQVVQGSWISRVHGT